MFPNVKDCAPKNFCSLVVEAVLMVKSSVPLGTIIKASLSPNSTVSNPLPPASVIFGLSTYASVSSVELNFTECIIGADEEPLTIIPLESKN